MKRKSIKINNSNRKNCNQQKKLTTIKNENILNSRGKKTKYIKIKRNSASFPPKKSRKNKKNIITIKQKKTISNSKNKLLRNNNVNNNLQYLNKCQNNEKKYNQNLEYNDYELNILTYEKALIYDKRTYIQYYISLLRINHLLIFSFYCNNKDYNSQIIKIFLFFLFFAVYFFVNALFFNDNTLHKIYIDKGVYNFIYQIPQILYSSLISASINTLLKFFSLSQRNILEIKNEENIHKFEKKVQDILSVIKIKFVIFFSISFLLLSFFTYFI